MNIKATKTPRTHETRRCDSCGTMYTAPVKIRGKGVIGGGDCPTCTRSKRPAREKQCPVCTKPFKVQAGHERETCSRTCQRVYTQMKRAADSSALGQEAIRNAERLKVQREAEERERRLQAEADAAKAETARLEAEAEAARQEAALKAERDQTEEMYRTGKGTPLERRAAVGKAIRNKRERAASAVPVPA